MEEKKKKILFVDDDKELCAFFIRALGMEGYEIICADNGDAAIEILKNSQELNLAVIDFMMPFTTGWELVNYIREESKFKELPIIIFTGLLVSEELLDKVKKDCFAILQKGDFDLEQFKKIVKEAIKSCEK
ncbi:MAG TPA: response regulator [Victivallales bacterium]|nr:response regulator [Victivallales bacterium]HPO90738.1 response regulator [Victivallales bacterium]HRR05958.1 response regulator [Victivallales bacterium]HRR28141.1 response regulator [Victivallales bacterium]HRU00160.1 response regulator [Victivallales bacterium]